MFTALLAIAEWAAGHPDLIETAYKDVAALLGKHFASPPSHDAQVALQAGIAAAAAQLHQAVIARGGPRPGAIPAQPMPNPITAPLPVHVQLAGENP